MRFFLVAAAAAALACSAAATAQSNSDARCIVLSSAFARSGPNEQAKQLAQAALNFYLGRVSPAASSAQLKALFDQQMATITDANDGQLMGECIKNFQAVVSRVDNIAAQSKPATKPTQPDGR